MAREQPRINLPFEHFFVSRRLIAVFFVLSLITRIYTGEIGDVTVVGGTKVNNSCVKKSSEGSEVSQRMYQVYILIKL